MAHICHHECAILNAKVGMWEVWQHGHDLILESKCRDQWAHGSTASKIVQKLQFILNSNWATGNVDLLQRHISGFLVSGMLSFNSASFGGRAGPGFLFLRLPEDIPVVMIVVVK